MTSALISAAELQKILGQPHVKVLDASYNLPPTTMGIAGALEFDIDDVADPAAPFAHTVPTPGIFAEKVRARGISNDDLVVIYDRSGIAMAAARAWWMFRLFGHDKVRILDGGLPAWLKAGHTVTEKASAYPASTSFGVKFRPELLKQLGQVVENVTSQGFTVLDARDAARYRGDTPDPRPQVATGHIPGSLSLPFMTLINPDGTLKAKDQLEKALQTAYVNMQRKITCSCGSGVTACVIALALYELGHRDAAVYDGSWTEWGSNPALPKEKGSAAKGL